MPRAVVHLVNMCLDIRPMITGGILIDLNDIRYERMLRVYNIKENAVLEEYVQLALLSIKEYYGKEHMIFSAGDIPWLRENRLK